jgi:spermidine/putrescine transport system ATP-binding protein
VRPEKIVIGTEQPAAGLCALRCRVKEVIYLGTSTQYDVLTPDGATLTVFVQNASDAQDLAERDDKVWLSWRPEHSLALAGSPTPQPATEPASELAS